MKIAIMMRAMDDDSGFRAYTQGLVETMLRIDEENSYLLLYRTTKWFGHFASCKNAQEILLWAPHKLAWDQVAVPYTAWREQADVIFNPKFSIPLISHCPVAMGLQEPAWWAFPEHYEKMDLFYMRTMLPFYCRKASHILPMSDFVLTESRKHLKLPLDNTTVTYAAPDKIFKRIENPAILHEFRNKYQLPPKFILGLPRVSHAGLDNSTSFFPGKNAETTVRAFALCRERIPHKLVLGGRRTREYLLSRGLTGAELEDVHFLGPVPYQELPPLFSLAEVLVTPAWYEGFSHILIHAMACGCPAIAAQTGGYPEVSAGAALLADPSDPADFAAKIMTVVNHQDRREEMRLKGLQRAAELSWERTARLTLHGLMQAGAAPRGADIPVPVTERPAPGIVAGRRAIGDLAAAQGLFRRLGAKVAELEYATMAAGAPRGQWLRRLLMSLAGCILFSLGVKLYIDADLGTDPLHSMIIGATQALDLAYVGVGLGTSIVTGVFLALWSAWNRRLPPLSTFATMALVGYLVDFWNLIGLERYTSMLEGPVAMMLTGVLLHAYASALIVMSGIGIRVMDLVVVSTVRNWGWPFVLGKLSIEAGFFAAAWSLGGPIGAGTVAFLAVVGCFVPCFMWANERLLRLPNYVLYRPAGVPG